MNTQKQIILIIALTFIFVGGCAAYSAIELPVRAPDQADWTRDQSLERGALLFANNCRTCHGNKGQGFVGPQLLNAELTQFQNQDPLVLKANQALLNRTLSCGRAGTLMPAWLNTNGGSLNAIQIKHIVNFLSAPIEVDEATGEATSHWWEEAEEFAHNLNGEVAVLVGGDTLGTIAKAHGIGPKELAAYNKLPVEGRIKKGTEIKIPPFKGDSNGYTYTVYKDNETITKIAEAQFVGSVIIADLNNIPYDFSEKRGVATMQLRTADEAKAKVAGLFPGVKLALPEGASYIITAGDTIQSIAKVHGISESQLTQLNRETLGSLKADEEIPFERTLALPKQIAIVQEGQTLGTIAQLHELDLADLAAENALAADAVVKAGQEVKLPVDAKYVVQTGDTWALIAQTHGTTAAELASKNGATPETALSPSVVIALPKIDGYVVQGQDLAAVAKGYGNVTAESLATKNNVQPNTILAVGTQLHLPEDAFGSAPPDAKNPGTACVQYAVPDNIWKTISGQEIKKPEAKSTTVLVEAHANDWTLTTDGTKLQPNAGAALISVGTVVKFTSVVGLHNINLNGAKQGDDINQGQTRDITFNTTGEFKITCTYHPAMQAIIWVE